MSALGEMAAGLAEIMGELVPGILESLIGIGNSDSHNTDRRSRHDPIRLNLAPHHGELDQNIVEPGRPINAPMT
jgi:hypothetical protein